MKKNIIRTTALLIVMTGFVCVAPAFAQGGDPPPPPDTHGSQQNEVPGGGVPVGSGMMLLISLGTAYGLKKARDIRKKD